MDKVELNREVANKESHTRFDLSFASSLIAAGCAFSRAEVVHMTRGVGLRRNVDRAGQALFFVLFGGPHIDELRAAGRHRPHVFSINLYRHGSILGGAVCKECVAAKVQQVKPFAGLKTKLQPSRGRQTTSAAETPWNRRGGAERH
jgi:hypothetical protein